MRLATPSPRQLAALKTILFLAALLPVGRLAWAVAYAPDSLGANPAETIEHATGEWTLRLLLLTLAVTPLRRLSGWNWLVRLRRMLGLFALFYGAAHLLSYVAFDQTFDWGAIVRDVAKRRFIFAGVAAFVLMVPLGVTSTRGWVRRLGKRWVTLHRLVYVSATLGVVHFWWLVKQDVREPLLYAAVLGVLLGARLVPVRTR